MPDAFFRGLFDSAAADPIAPVQFLLCVGTSLALGLLLLMGLVHQVILNQWGIKTMDSLEV